MRTALSVLALSAAVGAAAPGSAHWPLRAVIEVWIDGRDAPPGGDRLVERAMQTWTKAGEGRLTLQRTLIRTEAEIQVFFVRDGGNYGETRPHLDARTGLIDRADVAIAADVPVEPLTKQIVAYLTALHELGHALGLEHTTNFSDIMYLFRRPEDAPRYFGNYRALLRSPDDIGSAMATGLSADDVKALREISTSRMISIRPDLPAFALRASAARHSFSGGGKVRAATSNSTTMIFRDLRTFRDLRG